MINVTVTACFTQDQFLALALQRDQVTSPSQHIQLVLVGLVLIAGDEQLATDHVGGDERIDLGQHNQIDPRAVEKVFQRHRQPNLRRHGQPYAGDRANTNVQIRGTRRQSVLLAADPAQRLL